MTTEEIKAAILFGGTLGGGGGGGGSAASVSYDPTASGLEADTVQDALDELAGNVEEKYDAPAGGIPKTDLASAVQASLDRADSALQSVPNTYRTAAAQDTIDNGKENKGRITISGVEKTANTHTVTIVTNGVTSTFDLVGVS